MGQENSLPVGDRDDHEAVPLAKFISLCCRLPCNKPAEFQVYSIPSEGFEDFTDACAEHLTDLLDDRIEHHVFRINKEAGT